MAKKSTPLVKAFSVHNHPQGGETTMARRISRSFDRDRVNVAALIHSGNSHVVVVSEAEALAKALQAQLQAQKQGQNQENENETEL